MFSSLSLCVLFYSFPLPDSLLSLLHLGRLIKADWELKSWFPTLGSIQSAKNGCHSLCFGFSFAFFGFFPLFSPNFSLGGSARNGRWKTGTELTWQIWNPLVRIGFSYLVVGDLEGVIFTRWNQFVKDPELVLDLKCYGVNSKTCLRDLEFFFPFPVSAVLVFGTQYVHILISIYVWSIILSGSSICIWKYLVYICESTETRTLLVLLV